MQVLRALHLDAEVLRQRHHAGDDEQQHDDIRIVIARPGPEIDKRLAEEDDARAHERQNQKLDAPHAHEQLREHGAQARFVALVVLHELVDARREHGRHRRRKRDEVRVQLLADGVDRRGGRAAVARDDELIEVVVDLVDDHVDGDEAREHSDVFEHGAVKVPERDPNVQLAEAVDQPQHVHEHGDRHRDDDHADRAVARQQHRQRHERGYDRAQDLRRLQEHELLLRADDVAEHAHREAHGEVRRQQQHEDARRVVLGVRQAGLEHHLQMERQVQSARKRDQTDDGKHDQEQTVEPRDLVVRLFLAVEDVVAHVAAAEAETEHRQNGDRRGDGGVQAVLALAEDAQHERRVGDGDDDVERHLHIREQRAGTQLIVMLHSVSVRRRQTAGARPGIAAFRAGTAPASCAPDSLSDRGCAGSRGSARR